MNEPDTQHDSEPKRDSGVTPSRTRAWVRRWEQLPAQRQFLASWLVALLVIGAAHIPFVSSGNISVGRAVGYGLFEGLLVAFLVTLATQMELARKRDAES